MTRRPMIGPPATWPSRRTPSVVLDAHGPSQSDRAKCRGTAASEVRVPEVAISQPLVEWQSNVQPSSGIEKGVPLMVKVGDRIRLGSTKGPDRDGVVTAVTGSLLRVRWPSEEETTVEPAPGTLTVLAASDAVKETARTKKAARKKSASATKTTSGKKATPDKTRSRTRAARRRSR